MNQAFHLYRLQQIDSQISQVENQLKEVERLLAGDEEVQKAQKAVDDQNKLLQKMRQDLKETEFLVRNQILKIEQVESSLYSGKVRNPKELQDLQKEIASLKKHLVNLEDKQLEAMVAVEEKEQAVKEAESLYSEVKAKFLENSAGWAGQKENLLRNLERLSAERAPTLTLIDHESLSVYSKLRLRKNGVAVTSVNDGSCATCGGTVRPAEIQAARNVVALCFCSSCGRILYAG